VAYVTSATVGGKITAAFLNLIGGFVNRQGLTAVIPTSVAGSGVSLNAAGRVTFTTATAVNINGCFSSTFDNYVIVVDISATSANSIPQFRLRLAGTDASGATDYYSNSLVGSGASTAAAAFSTNLGYIATASLRETSGELRLFEPALAAPTRWTVTSMQHATTPVIQVGVFGGRHNLSTAYDGITIYPSTGNITGTFRIYGYNNNT